MQCRLKFTNADNVFFLSAEVFSVPTSKFLNYELTTWLPYFLKRHILRQKIEKPPPIIEREGKVMTM